MRARREYERDLDAGLDPDESDDAVAGDLLEAEFRADVHEILVYARAWYEANKRR